MSYDPASVKLRDIMDCFYFFPICPKKRFGVCQIFPFSNGSFPPEIWAGSIPGKPLTQGTNTHDFLVSRVTAWGGGQSTELCGLRPGRDAGVANPISPITTTPSLPTTFESNTTTEFTQSAYGAVLPIVFGSDKLAGNVFWYSGFDRDYTTDPETGDIIYYVRTSFAVGFCEGEIADIVRVWFGDEVLFDRTARTDGDGVIQEQDGEILSATLDLFSEANPLAAVDGSSAKTTIRFFEGSETQLPLGRMVDDEGYTLTPAYRGLAYMLIENLIVPEGTIPPIFVEVISDHATSTPRAFGTFDNTFTETRERLLEYRPEFDLVWVDAQEGIVTTGSHGLRVLNGGDLSEYEEYALPDADLDYVGQTPYLGYSWITPEGVLVRHWQVGNQGNTASFSAFDGTISHYDPTPRGGSVSLDHDDTGFAALDARSFIISGRNRATNETYHYLMGHGVLNRDVGIMAALKSGDMVMVGWADDVLPYNNAVGIAFDATTALYDENPLFADAVTSTAELAGIYLSYPSNANDTMSLTVVLPRINETTLQFSVTSAEILELDLDDIGGKGSIHEPGIMFQDPDDANLIIYFDVTPNTGYFAKINPFTGAVVWKTRLGSQMVGNSGANKRAGVSRIVDSFGFIDSADQLLRLDLATGGITVEDTDIVTNQSLPAPTASSLAWYDGISDSIFYTTSTVGKEIARVYVGRAVSDGVNVSTIVRSLLERVGVHKDQLNITDIETLSVTGYTISSIKALRSVFGELASVLRFDLYESDGAISYLSRGGVSARTISHEDLADVNPEGWLKEHQEPDFAGARKINLTYRDYDRDYTTNVQSIQLPKYVSTDFDEEAAVDVSAPVVLSAGEAKVLAEILLYSKIVYSSTFEGALPIKHLDLDPADVVTLERDDTTEITVRLREVTFGADRSLEFKATKEDPTIYTDTVTLFGNTGRFTSSIIGAYDPLVDAAWLPIPFYDPGQSTSFDEQWIFHAVLLPYKNSDTIPYDVMEFVPEDPNKAYTFDPPSTFPSWGTARASLVNTNAVFSNDRVSQVTVKLRNTGAITPTSATSEAAAIENPNINLCLVAGELCQYIDVSVSGGVYTLSNFIRGKFGTDRFATGHDVGDRVIFLADHNGVFDTTSHMELTAHADPHLVDPASHTGGPMHRLLLRGNSNNPYQRPHRTASVPLNLIPWPVGALEGNYDGSGDAVITWAFRDRFGLGVWEDDGDEATEVINREDTESYRVYFIDDIDSFDGDDVTTYLRTETVTSPTATYSDAEQITDGFDRTTDTLYVWVVQEGSDVVSTPWVTGTSIRIATI